MDATSPKSQAPSPFWSFVDTGARLADLHLNYEQAKEYPLKWIENKDIPFSWRVTRMQLSKDKTQIKVNESLTLAGIPAACFDYRLGNRSAQMRARLLLLNESPTKGQGQKDKMLASRIAGHYTQLPLEDILPKLWQRLQGQRGVFLLWARLWAVFHLPERAK